MVMPHGDGINGERLAQVHLDPLGTFFELDGIVIERLLLPVSHLADLTEEGWDTARDRLSLCHVDNSFRHLERHGWLVGQRLYVRAFRQIFGCPFEGMR